MDEEIYINDINKMNLSFSDKQFDVQHKADTHTYITFEIAKNT